MTLQGNRYACSSHRERGTCANNRVVAADAVEARVLAGVKNLLLAPDLIQAAMRSFEAELAQSRLSAIGRRASIEKAMTATEDRINRKRGAATLWIGG
jgi:hypothetical protein